MKKVCLIILDGWGVAPPYSGNAPSQAKLSFLPYLERFYPHCLLHASGINVGLPWWEPGNSEVGHLTIGAGKVIYQYLPRIINAIRDGSFFEKEAFKGACEHVKKNNSKLHLIGLLSSGAVHSYIDHLYALLELAKKENVKKVFLHLFSDGRDAPPDEGAKLFEIFSQRLEIEKTGKIATICGRSYGMDRAGYWERTKKAYFLMTELQGEKVKNIKEYFLSFYEKGIGDEYIPPGVVSPEGKIEENDALIFFNFREDRMRQIVRAFCDEKFDKFETKKFKNLYIATMTRYFKEDYPQVHVAFEREKVENPLGKVLERENLSQLKITETEKYAHVTYFFNGLREKPFLKEKRVIFPSQGGPRYDKNPEMQAPLIAERMIEAIENEEADFLLVNFANPDMVGHTGNIKAAIKAAEILDYLLKRIYEKNKGKYVLMISADHGNFEEMLSKKGEVLTEHSSNPVFFFLVDEDLKKERKPKKLWEQKPSGFLYDIAPTILDYLEIEVPQEMIGTSLREII